jgi:heme-degrading monooxygenase HmoA
MQENSRSAGTPGAGQCVRVVPSRLKPGTAGQWLAAHQRYHTPAVRRQPGFVSKVLLQAEDDPDRVAMLLTWETTEQALAWTKHPEHDTVSRPMGDFAIRDDASRGALPRGGYRVLAMTVGAGVTPAAPVAASPADGDPQTEVIKATA